jgi:hypothetical protein
VIMNQQIKDEVRNQMEQSSLVKTCPACQTVGLWEIELKEGNRYDPPNMRQRTLVVTWICLECRYVKHETVLPSITI